MDQELKNTLLSTGIITPDDIYNIDQILIAIDSTMTKLSNYCAEHYNRIKDEVELKLIEIKFALLSVQERYTYTKLYNELNELLNFIKRKYTNSINARCKTRERERKYQSKENEDKENEDKELRQNILNLATQIEELSRQHSYDDWIKNMANLIFAQINNNEFSQKVYDGLLGLKTFMLKSTPTEVSNLNTEVLNDDVGLRQNILNIAEQIEALSRQHFYDESIMTMVQVLVNRIRNNEFSYDLYGDLLALKSSMLTTTEVSFEEIVSEIKSIIDEIFKRPSEYHEEFAAYINDRNNYLNLLMSRTRNAEQFRDTYMELEAFKSELLLELDKRMNNINFLII